jgi:hypothetical protein
VQATSNATRVQAVSQATQLGLETGGLGCFRLAGASHLAITSAGTSGEVGCSDSGLAITYLGGDAGGGAFEPGSWCYNAARGPLLLLQQQADCPAGLHQPLVGGFSFSCFKIFRWVDSSLALAVTMSQRKNPGTWGALDATSTPRLLSPPINNKNNGLAHSREAILRPGLRGRPSDSIAKRE